MSIYIHIIDNEIPYTHIYSIHTYSDAICNKECIEHYIYKSGSPDPRLPHPVHFARARSGKLMCAVAAQRAEPANTKRGGLRVSSESGLGSLPEYI